MEQASLFGDDEHPDQTRASADEVLHWWELMASKKRWDHTKDWDRFAHIYWKYRDVIEADPEGKARAMVIYERLQKRFENDDDSFDDNETPELQVK